MDKADLFSEERGKKVKKKIAICTLILLLLILVVYFAAIPIPIRKEVAASSYVIGQNEISDVKIYMDGTLTMRIFKPEENRFEGQIQIEGYPESEGTLTTVKTFPNVYSMNYYFDGKFYPFGNLVSDFFLFSEFGINVAPDGGILFDDGQTLLVYPQITADRISETTERYREIVQLHK